MSEVEEEVTLDSTGKSSMMAAQESPASKFHG